MFEITPKKIVIGLAILLIVMHIYYLNVTPTILTVPYTQADKKFVEEKIVTKNLNGLETIPVTNVGPGDKTFLFGQNQARWNSVGIIHSQSPDEEINKGLVVEKEIIAPMTRDCAKTSSHNSVGSSLINMTIKG